MSKRKEKLTREDLLWKEAKEVLRLGKLYGLLDGTFCTSREQAIESNHELVREFSNGH